MEGFAPPLDRAELFDLAARDDVQSRLVIQNPAHAARPWRLRHGPFGRKSLPPLKQKAWTLLVQSVDLYDARVAALRAQFRFVPDARLDDVMISYASDQGGVGPHFDSYDVFLLQAQGQRRWRIGRQKDLRLQEGMPLKVLADFVPEEEYVLAPGDMLYLPPRYAHDGIAQGECMTCSIGFRAPARADLAREMLHNLAERAEESLDSTLYRDPRQAASAQPALIPAALLEFAQSALARALKDPDALACALGEYLTEPKSQVWFDAPSSPVELDNGFYLDRCSQMLYDGKHLFINGESYRAAGRDAKSLRTLADTHHLSAKACQQLSPGAKDLVLQWAQAGWVHWAG
jgi:50S ribosomal protein L16 3-hydroxylase